MNELCEARTLDEKSFETTFGAIGLLVQALERSPSFDLEFDLEGQVAQPRMNFVRLELWTRNPLRPLLAQSDC